MYANILYSVNAYFKKINIHALPYPCISTTKSLRRDHDVIEKVTKSIQVTAQMLRNGTVVPEPILRQVIDFTTNFTDVCHHSKEEKGLFPALVESGMPSNMGPIAVMLMEHEKSRQLAENIKKASDGYLESGNPEILASNMEQYAKHITEHLWKENNRLFMMADMRLGNVSEKVDSELDRIETDSLTKTGNNRSHYEEIAENLDGYAAGRKSS